MHIIFLFFYESVHLKMNNNTSIIHVYLTLKINLWLKILHVAGGSTITETENSKYINLGQLWRLMNDKSVSHYVGIHFFFFTLK